MIIYYESPFHVSDSKEIAEKKCAIVDEILEMTKDMEPLGGECQKVLNDNLWDLYEK